MPCKTMMLALICTACAQAQTHASTPSTDALTCVPPPIIQGTSLRPSPSRNDVVDQMSRVAPLIRACGDRFPSRYYIVPVKLVVSGASGKVLRIEIRSVTDVPFPAGLSECIGTAFQAACFVPFEAPEFSVTFPFKLVD